jgi:hypothetical protein
MTYPEFYDSAPAEWPAGAADVALYADSSLQPGYDPQLSPAVFKRYITRRGGAAAAAYAGIADFEAGNLVFTGDLLREWAAARLAAGHRARVYCNRTDVHTATAQLGDQPAVEWWIATLDNNPHWTPALIVASVRAVTGITLAEDRIWGIQWGTNAAYDTSYLTGRW